MSSPLARATVLLTVVLVAAAALADDPPEWTSVGPADVTATGLIRAEWHGQLLFLTTPDGYLIYHRFDETWTSHEEPGVPGREVTALDDVPRLDHRLLTGRIGADGHGVIEMSFPLGRNDVVHTCRGGALADLEVAGYYTPYGLACSRALGEDDGEMLASADTGSSWQEITGHGHRDLTDLFVYSSDEWYVSGDAGVMHTADGGTTWEPRNDGLPAGLVTGLWVDGPYIAVPAKQGRDMIHHILATMADGVYHTWTADVAWTRVLAAPDPREVVWQADPYGQHDHVFVLTGDDRILLAEEGQWQWEDLTGTLVGDELVGTIYDPPWLYVATASSGVYRAEVHLWQSSDVPDAGLALELAVAPNPFNPGTTLSFTAHVAGHATLAVFDLRGRQVATLLDGPVDVGERSLTWRPDDLASGVYLARLQLDGQAATRRVMLVR
jgi:hypothetical protein